MTVADKIVAMSAAVEVDPGGLRAQVAGETYEEANPSAVARQVGNALYQTAHHGREQLVDKRMRTLRDPRFEARLREAAGERRTTLRATVVERREGRIIVDTGTLRLNVPDSSVRALTDEQVDVEVDAVRPALSPGFVFAGHGHRKPGPLLRLYARIDDPDAAAPVWKTLLEFLDRTGAVWEAKILSNRALYPRNDALVVYLGRDGWRHARDCATAMQSTGLLGQGTSPFARAITESVCCAFEPDDRTITRQGLSFGQHRAHVLAQAVIRHAVDQVPEMTLAATIHAAFLDAGIDPNEPARNLSSPVVDVLGLN
ncbi:T3SS effector HopA1 family protein [Nocardia sp. NPDC051570]|uniref:T3SS effector HopA1 family protein n=1 Tax=Nocardia sp. NPDC051570 TaxID=3364324 RepID=UPI0037A820B9